MVALLSVDLVSNPVTSNRYHSCQEQHYQALTAPTVASPVSQSRASRLSLAATPLQRNGPRCPSTRLGAMDQDVIQSNGRITRGEERSGQPRRLRKGSGPSAPQFWGLLLYICVHTLTQRYQTRRVGGLQN